MSANPPGVRARRPAPQDRPSLNLDVERVLDVTVRQPVRAEFRFDPDSPLVVSVRFVVAGGPRVLWRIGRDLLRQGLCSMSGLGDVQVWPCLQEERGTAWLQLTAGDMAALFEFPVAPLAEWLDRTCELVPAGRELDCVDWDAATARLLRAPDARSG